MKLRPPTRNESTGTSEAFSIAIAGSPAILPISDPQEAVVGELERLGRTLGAVDI